MKIDLSYLRPIHIEGKKWGEEWWITNTEDYCCKILFLKANFQCSLHYHVRKTEDFIILSGAVTLEQRDVRGIPFSEFLMVGDKRTIESRTPHRFSSREDSIILEVSTRHSESDSIRLTESGPIECTQFTQSSTVSETTDSRS